MKICDYHVFMRKYLHEYLMKYLKSEYIIMTKDEWKEVYFMTWFNNKSDNVEKWYKQLFEQFDISEFDKKFSEAKQYMSNRIIDLIYVLQLRKHYPHHLNGCWEKGLI